MGEFYMIKLKKIERKCYSFKNFILSDGWFLDLGRAAESSSIDVDLKLVSFTGLSTKTIAVGNAAALILLEC